jgi:hypothetical protein
MKAPAGLRKKRHKHAQQQAQQRHPNKVGPIRDVGAPRTRHLPSLTFFHAFVLLSDFVFYFISLSSHSPAASFLKVRYGKKRKGKRKTPGDQTGHPQLRADFVDKTTEIKTHGR